MPQNLMAKVGDRALSVSPQEATAFPFDAVDVLICQNLLAGCSTAKSLSAAIGNTTEICIRDRLLDPVRCAWISQQLSAAVGSRLGMVLTSVYGRAVTTGDPKAAELLLKRYGEMAPVRTEVVNTNVTVDLTKLPPEILEKMIAEKMRGLGLKRETQEAECIIKESSAPFAADPST